MSGEAKKESLAEAGEDIQKRVDRVVFEDFYGSPLAGSKERLAKALIREFGLSALRAQPPAREDAQPMAWACKTCNSPRAVDPCQKCGTALTKPADGWEWPGLPDIDRIRRLAREVGYAVGVHGTMERDLDLIAAPWVAEAVGPAELAQHIADGLGGEVVNGDNQDKPCGRWSCNIHTPDWTKLIDLSVMPPITHPAPDALRVAVEALEYIARRKQTCASDEVEAWELQDKARQTLSALQAEQDSKS